MKLGVNIDHVATLRQQRRGREPEPVTAALVAEMVVPTASSATFVKTAGIFRKGICLFYAR